MVGCLGVFFDGVAVCKQRVGKMQPPSQEGAAATMPILTEQKSRAMGLPEEGYLYFNVFDQAHFKL